VTRDVDDGGNRVVVVVVVVISFGKEKRKTVTRHASVKRPRLCPFGRC